MGLKQVQVMIGLADRSGCLAMYRGYAVQREEVGVQLPDQEGNLLAVAADHALIRGVDDQQIDPIKLCQLLTHLLSRCHQHP